MRLPRLTIASVMAVVIIVAINLAAIRALNGTTTPSLIGALIVCGSLPMASILMLGVPKLVRELSSGRGRSNLFLIGFEGAGWTIFLIYTGCTLLFPDSVNEVLVMAIALKPFDDSDLPWLLFVSDMLIVQLVLFAPALVGGWLNRGFKVRLIIERRKACGLGSINSMDDLRASSAVPSLGQPIRLDGLSG